MRVNSDYIVSLNDESSHITNHSNIHPLHKCAAKMTWIPIYVAAGLGAILNVIYFSYLLYSSIFSSQVAPANQYHITSHDLNSLCNVTSVNGTSVANVAIVNDVSPVATVTGWQQFNKLVDQGWCHYPEYESTIAWDDYGYHESYLTKHEPETSCSTVYPLSFSINVSNTGYLTVSNCTNNQFNYSTAIFPSDTTKYSAVEGVQMKWPSTFVYVWCNADPNPAFITFHVPKPPQDSDRQLPAPGVNRPNVLFLQIDALSYKRLPVVMPKTFQLMERLTNQTTSSSNVSAWKFNKFSVTGYNSAPAFQAIYGHTRGARDPESRAWLWRQAKDLGYITSFSETCCLGAKYSDSGAGIDIGSQEAGKYMDYNWMLPFCSTGSYFQEHTQHCTRGKINFKHMYDPLLQALEYYQSINQPFFFSGNLLEAHIENSFPARHMDDAGYADYLERLISMPNTVTVFMSDHGLHYGKYFSSSSTGMTEHRHPFLYLTSTVKDLRVDPHNLNRLVTPFDLWLTVTHLISGVDYTSPAKTQEMGFSKSMDFSVDLFREVTPATRSCHQTHMERQESSNTLNWVETLNYCACQSPFSLMCPMPRSMLPDLWQECTQNWAHPNVFDVHYYANKNQINDPCDALTHWCTKGIHRRLQSKPAFTLQASGGQEHSTYRVMQDAVNQPSKPTL